MFGTPADLRAALARALSAFDPAQFVARGLLFTWHSLRHGGASRGAPRRARDVLDPHPGPVGGRKLGAPLHPERAPASLVARLAGGGFSTRRPRRFVRSPGALRSGGASASRPMSDSCFSLLSAVLFSSGGARCAPAAQSGAGEGAASAGGVLKLLQCRIPCILSSCAVRSFAHFREIADS